jgi:lipoprotein NlpI
MKTLRFWLTLGVLTASLVAIHVSESPLGNELLRLPWLVESRQQPQSEIQKIEAVRSPPKSDTRSRKLLRVGRPQSTNGSESQVGDLKTFWALLVSAVGKVRGWARAAALCNGSESNVSRDLQISACTEVILTRREHPPIVVDALYHRGKAYFAKELYDLAIYDFDEVIRLEPNWDGAFLYRGLAYRHSDQYERAIQDYDQAIHLNPVGHYAYNLRCWARALAGTALELAIADCNRALELRPGDADTLNSRCFVRFRMGDFEHAISDCNKSLLHNPKNPWSLYFRGLSMRRNGDLAAGDRDIVTAKQLDPGVATRFEKYDSH